MENYHPGGVGVDATGPSRRLLGLDLNRLPSPEQETLALPELRLPSPEQETLALPELRYPTEYRYPPEDPLLSRWEQKRMESELAVGRQLEEAAKLLLARHNIPIDDPEDVRRVVDVEYSHLPIKRLRYATRALLNHNSKTGKVFLAAFRRFGEPYL